MMTDSNGTSGLAVRRARQTGQAMTEFVVSVSYVFLGIFVIVPTFGKLMDLQHQNQMASRYVAWERTVWFDEVDMGNDNQDDFEISSDEFESVATRSDDDVMNSLTNRFFYGSGTGALKYISEDDVNSPGGDTSPIWTYVQSKETMYGGTTLGDGTDHRTGREESLDKQQTPSIAYDILDFLNTGIKVIADPLNDFLGLLGGDNRDFLTFAYDLDNYYSPVIRTQLNVGNSKGGGAGVWDTDASGNWGSGIEDAIFQNWDGVFEARSAILADGWNTQSLAHYEERANDMVPSTVFNNALFDAVITVASLLEGGPEKSAVNKLEFGAVGVEPMPAVDGEPLEPGCDDGFCYYDE